MKTRFTLVMMAMFLALTMTARADETITVTANNEDISQNLDLKAVATLFGESANLEEFEKQLNDESARFSNLDLNGDGLVDYLRVIETAEGNKHLIVLQAVLAQDIFQDVASIFVEKDEATQNVTVQVVGDEYIYGANYVIEPVYIYRPVIYDWFWGPSWYCWHSPWYWGYWAPWYHSYHCWLHHDYWHHIYGYHHHHPYCSFRQPPHPSPRYHEMYGRAEGGRHDFATRHPEQSFASRNAGRVSESGRAVANARDIQPSRSGVAARSAAQGTARSASATDRTFGSTNTRVGNPSAARSASSASSARGGESVGSRSAAQGTQARSASQASAARTTTAPAARSASSTVTTSRGTSSASTVSRGTTSSQTTVTRSSSSASTTTTARPAASTVQRSNSSSSAARPASSTVQRSSSSSSSSSARSASSGATRSSASTPSRSSSYSGGSSSYGGSSRGGFSGGSSSGSSRGGFSGGSSSGGSRGGSAPSGGSRGGAGGGGRR